MANSTLKASSLVNNTADSSAMVIGTTNNYDVQIQRNGSTALTVGASAVTSALPISVTGGATLTGLADISNASAGQIKFPSTQNASADVNTLDDYTEGNITFTLVGCTTSPTITARYTKIGRLVNITFPNSGALTGTSNATTKSITGLPASLWPSQNIMWVSAASDNGAGFVIATNTILTSGVVNLYKDVPNNNWTASGTMQVFPSQITYSL